MPIFYFELKDILKGYIAEKAFPVDIENDRGILKDNFGLSDKQIDNLENQLREHISSVLSCY